MKSCRHASHTVVLREAISRYHAVRECLLVERGDAGDVIVAASPARPTGGTQRMHTASMFLQRIPEPERVNERGRSRIGVSGCYSLASCSPQDSSLGATAFAARRISSSTVHCRSRYSWLRRTARSCRRTCSARPDVFLSILRRASRVIRQQVFTSASTLLLSAVSCLWNGGR